MHFPSYLIEKQLEKYNETIYNIIINRCWVIKFKLAAKLTHFSTVLKLIWEKSITTTTEIAYGNLSAKVARSKPPPVLTSGFNQLKLLRSICEKVINTCQYESDRSIEI